MDYQYNYQVNLITKKLQTQKLYDNNKEKLKLLVKEAAKKYLSNEFVDVDTSLF